MPKHHLCGGDAALEEFRCHLCRNLFCEHCFDGDTCYACDVAFCARCDSFTCETCDRSGTCPAHRTKCDICGDEVCDDCLDEHKGDRHECDACGEHVGEFDECKVCGEEFCVWCLETEDPVGWKHGRDGARVRANDVVPVCEDCGAECRQCGVRHPAEAMKACKACALPHMCPACDAHGVPCFDCR